MKRLIFLTIFFSIVFATMAQTRLSMRIWKDGVVSKYVLEEIDSVMFVEDVFIPDNVVTTENAITIVWNAIGFEPCISPDKQLVLAGDYNNWNTYPVDMVNFEPLYGHDNWWKAVITPDEDATSPLLVGIPCGIAKDGTFSWDYQWADVEAGNCEVISGDAVIKKDAANQLQLHVHSNSSIVYIRSYGFQKDPCETESSACENAVKNAIEILTEPTKTWEMAYFPNLEASSIGYNMVLKFNKNGNVSVSAKNSTTTGNELKTDSCSTWVVKSDYGPLLSFDTYNKVFHAFSDPRSDGAGLLGDYEFYILKATSDLVLLKGKKHGAYCVMRPMKHTNLENYFANCERMQTELFGNNNVVTLVQGNAKTYLHEGATGRFASFVYGERLTNKNTTYHPLCVTEDGIIVSTGFGNNDQERIFIYDSINGELKGESGSVIKADNLNILFGAYFTDNNHGWAIDTTGLAHVAEFLDEMNTLVKDIKKNSKIKLLGYGYKQSLNMYEGGHFIVLQVSYKQNGKGTEQIVNLVWTVDVTYDERGITVGNAIPYDNNPDDGKEGTTERWMRELPVLQDIVSNLSGTFTATYGTNLFNAAAGMKLVGDDCELLIKGATNVKM